ncbi:MAG TPA: 3-phosphoglycerate dehydrogenase [Verrucomicrobia bacterium]|nr:3-phosphoglycerate dehydrogenase [Verrucomicrobiales bacterium]HIL53576.1 3-phosphoglycerate dehydrogenase [Verrucomicrobiota bacterium]
MRILLTTTSYQDTPGPHHDLLASTGWEIARERGPLPEEKMLEIAGEFDGFLCGDDSITKEVINKSLPHLKVISKYGIGLDKINVEHATAKKIPILFTPGVNHTTVAEHCFGLLLGLTKKIHSNANEVASGSWKAGWKKPVGNEILGKTIGIIGLGRIGKEVAIRASVFGLNIIAYDPFFDEEFANVNGIRKCSNMDEVLCSSDIVSLHCFLNDETHGMINSAKIEQMKDNVIVINCARGELVEAGAMKEGLLSGRVGGYGTDVLDSEPPQENHPLLDAPNCIITSHIASRTHESVERQAGMATRNLISFLNGKDDYTQANKFDS